MATYQEPIAQSSDDAHNTNFGVYDDDNTWYYLARAMVAGIAGWRFQSLPIPQGATITNAELRFLGTHKCAAGMCRSICHGIDEDDLDTWQSGVNEPEDAAQTSASDTYQTSTNFVSPNGACIGYTFDDLAAAVQEIVDRVGWSSGNDMGFLTEDNGSTGLGVWIRAHTYDSGDCAPPQLTVTYATDGEVVELSAVSAACSAEDSVVVPGAATVDIAGASLASSAAPLQAAPGPVTKPMSVAAVASSAQPSAILAGGTQVSMGILPLAGTVGGLSLLPGAVTRLMGAVTVASSALTFTVSADGTQIAIGSLSLASSASNLSVLPGAVTRLVGAATITLSAQTLVPLMGETQIAVDNLSLVSSTKNLSVLAGAAIAEMQAVILGLPVPEVDVMTGAVTNLMDAAEVTSSAQTSVLLAGETTIGMGSLPLHATAGGLSLLAGAVTAMMQAIALGSSVLGADVVPGTVTKEMSCVLLAGSAKSVVVVPGAGLVGLGYANLAADTQKLDLALGGVAMPMGTVVLSPSAGPLTWDGAVVVPLDSAAAILSPQEINAIIPAIIAAVANLLTLKSGSATNTLTEKHSMITSKSASKQMTSEEEFHGKVTQPAACAARKAAGMGGVITSKPTTAAGPLHG